MSLSTVWFSVELKIWFQHMINDSFLAALKCSKVAPVVTTLLCLLVISLESLISSFQFVPPSLTKEWVITQAWTGLSVCGIQGSGIHKVPVFSLSEEEGLTDNCLGIAFVNKTWVLGFSFLVCPIMLMSSSKAIGWGTVRAKVTSEPAWVPIE